jgi:hypothetical protein
MSVVNVCETLSLFEEDERLVVRMASVLVQPILMVNVHWDGTGTNVPDLV